MQPTAKIHDLLGVPQSAVGKLLARHFTPAYVTAPHIGTRLVWLELYRAGSYPNGSPENYYAAATLQRIEA